MVTLAQAKAHLRITTPDGHPDDADLQEKLAGAEAAIARFVARSEMGAALVAGWTAPEVTPPDARYAVLLQLGEAWRFRGDDLGAATAPRVGDGDFSPTVLGLLRRFSHSVLA